jgi:hypothetical protein
MVSISSPKKSMRNGSAESGGKISTIAAAVGKGAGLFHHSYRLVAGPHAMGQKSCKGSVSPARRVRTARR